MGTGQTLLSIGALVILGMTVISINRGSINSGVLLNATEIGITGISLAQSLIEEAAGKSFDEVTVGGSEMGIQISDLSNTLGRDPDESTEPTFDDFDDFNNFSKQDSLWRCDNFFISTRVEYADSSNPFRSSIQKSFFKLMTVWVTPMNYRAQISEGFRTPEDSSIVMKYVYTYW